MNPDLPQQPPPQPPQEPEVRYREEPEPRKSPPVFQPMLYALVLVVGLALGMQTGGFENQRVMMGAGESRGRLVHILDQIEHTYVDPIMRDELEAVAVDAILEKLDPHSYYFSPEEIAAMAEPMEGNFEGIGVEFLINADTLRVVQTIAGGPSEEAGIRAGDCIVAVEGEPISGPDLTNARVLELLKGPRGTEVRIGIHRLGKAPFDVTLERDEIPIHSVVAAAQIPDSDTGYIKVVRFASNTAEEFEAAMEQLDAAALKKVVVDLRGNGGGYLNAVVPMVKSFLRKGQMVVYTEGSHSPRRTYKASRDGRWVDWDLAVLIDESSASASEIFAGAIQDNDRGVTIGRRSFGKGLVQEEFGLPGSGALRLTVARFYTPTGRAIQKPYGLDVDYGDDYVERYDSGELFHRDSIPQPDSLRYETPGGRVVFGGGGITPDVFVPFDTSSYSNFLADVTWAGILRDAAFDFVDGRRTDLEGLPDWQSLPEATFEDAVEVLVAAADSAGFVVPHFADWERDVIRQRMGAQVARNLFGESAYHEVMLGQDRMVGEARVWLEKPEDQQVVAGELTLQTKQSQQNSTQNGI